MSVVARAPVVENEVLLGLRMQPKRLPRLSLDARGAELFDQVTMTDDYYPRRVELRVLDECLPRVAADVGVAARVIELGPGSGIMIKRLLGALDQPAAHTLVSDFMRPFTVPVTRRTFGRTLVFMPGTTIGTFEPHDAVAFLSTLVRIAGPNSRLLLGADGTRESAVVERAYNDLEGVTAELNKNVLVHLNRARGTCFDVNAFEHRAVWSERHSRIEMRLISTRDQRVELDGHTIDLALGEHIVTEYGYKHSLPALRGMLLAAGWQVREVFTGKEQPMRLWLCEPAV